MHEHNLNRLKNAIVYSVSFYRAIINDSDPVTKFVLAHGQYVSFTGHHFTSGGETDVRCQWWNQPKFDYYTLY